MVALFIGKNKTIFKNKGQSLGQDGLVYDTAVLGELVNRDTDGDGILDWEESLWGTDPTKNDTDGDGTPDDTEIARLKAELVGSESINPLIGDIKNQTETDKFLQELFTTVVALNQSGELDQATIDIISSSLAENLKNSTPQKIYTVKDIKITTDESKAVVQEYNNKLQALQTKYPLNEDLTAIFTESIDSDGEINVKVFDKLDPIISQINGIIKEMLLINTPNSLSVLHVATINGFQKLSENLRDMKLVESDTILAFSATLQYEQNSVSLRQYIDQLLYSVNQKLNN